MDSTRLIQKTVEKNGIKDINTSIEFYLSASKIIINILLENKGSAKNFPSELSKLTLIEISL